MKSVRRGTYSEAVLERQRPTTLKVHTKGMEEILKTELGDQSLKYSGSSSGGCINEGITYVKGNGEKIFVKVNHDSKAHLMFEGEFKSLESLSAMNIVTVPKPFKMFDLPDGGAVIVMEHLNFGSLNKYSSKLGELLARLHLLNSELEKKAEHSSGFVGGSEYYKYVDKFGFDVVTCCGIIPQDNTWQDDWTTYYARKIKIQMDLLEKDYSDREAMELWSQLQPKLPDFFQGLEIKPALMHGDLWGGNVGETDKEPVIFDPACFYGHSEFDLSISRMFGGFSSSFFSSYHKVLPQASGFQRRTHLYELFHYLNHWNHFGTSYRGSTISTFKKLLR